MSSEPARRSDPDGGTGHGDLVERTLSGCAAVQALQEEYDAVGWAVGGSGLAKTRHLLYHLLAVTTELARTVEEAEHAQERGDEVTDEDFAAALAAHPGIGAKLVFHAAQVANVSGLDLGSEVVGLYGDLAQRFAPDSALARLGLSRVPSPDPTASRRPPRPHDR